MPWIAAAAAVVSSGIGALSSGSSQRSANRANAQNAADTNAANLNLFRLSRGAVDSSTGQASAFLPYYFNGIEPQLASYATSIFQNGLGQLGSAADQYGRAQVTLNQLQPALDASRQAVLGQYNGANLNQRLQNFAPLADARIGAATAQSDAIRQALARQLGQVAANRARGGFYGGSSFEQNLANRSAIDAYRQAALTRSNANLQNAADVYGLQNADLQGRLDSSLPLNFVNNQYALNSLPQAQVNQNFQNLLAPFNSFRLQPQAFQQQGAPLVQPSINAGQVIGSGLGSAAQAYMNYQLNKPQTAATPAFNGATPYSASGFNVDYNQLASLFGG